MVYASVREDNPRALAIKLVVFLIYSCSVFVDLPRGANCYMCSHTLDSNRMIFGIVDFEKKSQKSTKTSSTTQHAMCLSRKKCLRGFRPTGTQTSLLNYRD